MCEDATRNNLEGNKDTSTYVIEDIFSLMISEKV